MESVSTWYKEENDFLYRKGRKLGVIEGKLEGILEGKLEGIVEGKLEGKLEVVESLIKKLELSDNHIADLAKVDIDFVKRVRQEINNKQLSE
jgi:predicted transposase YdaD